MRLQASIRRHALLSAVSIGVFISSFPVAAQTAPAPRTAAVDTGMEEIMVTARKRQESILRVPVIETAIPMERLQRLNITDMADLPKIVPGLNLGHSLLSIGTLISIRGVGPSTQDPGVDQSTSLNIDGLSLTSGLAFSSGMFDVGQVEVLKGPQALFYGKSSPAGVVSIRSADPTDKFEVVARASYEIESIAKRGELIVSGPVSDVLKLRLAGMYSESDGYFKNVAIPAPGTGAAAPSSDREPHSKNYIVRGTALWDQSTKLTARLKFTLTHDRALNPDTWQYTSCPTGYGPFAAAGNRPFLGGGEDCKLDRISRTVALDPAAFPIAMNNGVPFLDTYQRYGTLELNYRLADELNLSSTTALYHLHSKSTANATLSTYAAPFIGVNNQYRRRELTEEVRLNSDYQGPVNFTLGALYEDGGFTNHATVMGNRVYGLAARLSDGVVPVDIKTYSAFGQLRWKIVSNLELAGGLRWTDEKRVEAPLNYLTNTPTVTPTPALHTKNVAPEITLTYTPTEDLTLFGAFKKTYKSGSFSVATPAVTGVDNSFGDEKVEGGELGMKSRLAARQLALNLAGYYYHYSGMQLGATSPPLNGVPITRTVNAGSARTYGIDLDAAYHPAAIEGLSLNIAINWNHARFTSFNNSPCWGGQLISQGCNQLFNPAVNVYTAQNLSQTPLVRAPSWHVNFGFDYEYALQSDYKLIFSNSNEYSSKFVTVLAAGRPNNDNYQRQFAKVDLGLTLRSPKNIWELAVIGKNVTDKITSGNCSIANYGAGSIIANPSGVATATAFGTSPLGCFADPGREVWLRLTVRPFGAE